MSEAGSGAFDEDVKIVMSDGSGGFQVVMMWTFWMSVLALCICGAIAACIRANDVEISSWPFDKLGECLKRASSGGPIFTKSAQASAATPSEGVEMSNRQENANI